MSLIEWTPALEIGHKEIDEDHRLLVGLLNRFHMAGTSAETDELMAILAELGKHASAHFEREEALMRTINFEFGLRHRKEHLHLFDELTDRIAVMKAGATNAPSVAYFIRDWLLQHVAVSDRPLGQALLRSTATSGPRARDTARPGFGPGLDTGLKSQQ